MDNLNRQRTNKWRYFALQETLNINGNRHKMVTAAMSGIQESMMPDSPDLNTPTQLAGLPMSRPHSLSTTGSGLHENQSPLSTINEHTPSSHSNSSVVSEQLPPACGARQLSKLKRFLTTLQQFGSDISPEIGERVRSLVLALVNNHVSIEEFHAKLQEATNFPLRPFVIPFLKANLPLLQRELLHCARIAKQSPQQYLQHNDHVLLDHSRSSTEPHHSLVAEFNENGKRRSPDRPKENGLDCHLLSPHAPKRPHPLSPVSNGLTPQAHPMAPMRLDEMGRDQRERFYSHPYGMVRDPFEHFERIEDDWKHVESLLQCIVGMVEKSKRTMGSLQERSTRDRDELSSWIRRNAEGLDADVKKRHDEIIALNLRQTEERVAEVKRRAEEAVNEVKRQAVSELQKAVSASEQKANELVMAERVKMEKVIVEVRKAAQEEAMTALNLQSDSRTNCWNCGRKANETCSGCNVARYCGSFCQHKDWENHHLVCGKQTPQSGGKPAASATATSDQEITSGSPQTREASKASPSSSEGDRRSSPRLSDSRKGSPKLLDTATSTGVELDTVSASVPVESQTHVSQSSQ